MKGVVVAVGLSLSGGAALAAGPTPVGAPVHVQDRFDRDRDGGWHDGKGGRWNDNDDWDGYNGGRFDGMNFRLFRAGRAKMMEGRQLQNEASQLRAQARWQRDYRLERRAQRLDDRGDRLVREGLRMMRRARA